MKAFLLALVAIAAIAVGSEYAFREAGFSSAEYFQTENVRLGD